MNLVQINERLKDLPMQVIQQYANGMNPEVPPYLALGELQRREIAQKQMATAQGAAQGPQPSVKEQMEQKAGLMAAQGLQQQQAMEQLAQRPQSGLPIPDGMPQPEPQPEPPQAMMAGGGLARAPVRFDFQHGGIVAFATGDKVPDPRRERKAGESFADFRKRMFDLDLQLQREKNAVEESGRESERQRRLAERGSEIIPPSPFLERAPLPTPNAPALPAGVNRGLLNQADASTRAAPPAPPAPIADIKALLEQQKRQQAPRPTQAPAQAPAQPAQAPAQAPAQPAPESMDAMLRAQMAAQPKQRTLEEQLAEQKAAREGAGMTEPAGAAQMARLKALQEQYESSKPSGLDDLIRVFGQAGQAKGLSGLAPAYTANQQQKRAADLEMAQKINELMGGVETTQRGEMKDIATGALAGLGVDRNAQELFRREKLQQTGAGRTADVQAGTQQRGQDIQASTQQRGQDLNYRAAMAQVNAMVARNNLELTANQKALIADKALDNVNATLKANMKLQIEVGKNPAKMQELLQAETARLMAAAGGAKMATAPGAGSPGGTTRMRFDAQGNPIK